MDGAPERGASGADREETFTMTSAADQLVRMRSWLWTALVSEDLPLEECASLLVAVTELCTNSIKHAYQGRPGQSIHVILRAALDRVVLEVEDFGIPFDPARYVPPDLDATPDHGLGIFLVRRIANRVDCDVERERGTRWTLTKYRPGRRPEPAPAEAG